LCQGKIKGGWQLFSGAGGGTYRYRYRIKSDENPRHFKEMIRLKKSPPIKKPGLGIFDD